MVGRGLRPRRSRNWALAPIHGDCYCNRDALISPSTIDSGRGLRVTGQEMSIDDAVALAIRLHQEGRLADAQSVYRQILDADPKNADALHYLGVIAHQSGNSKAAVGLIRQAIQEAPDDAPLYSNLGEAQRALGDLDGAIASYRQAVDIDPSFPMAHNNLGNILADAGRLEDAKVCYEQAVSLDTTDPQIRFNYANVLVELGRPEDAIDEYRQILDSTPRFPAAWNALGMATEVAGSMDDAVNAFQSALDLDPNFDDARVNLERAQFQQHQNLVAFADREREIGNLDAAATAYEQVLAQRPEDAGAFYGLGICREGQGHLRDAIAAFDSAARNQPFFEDALAALGEILIGSGDPQGRIADFDEDRHAAIWTALAIAHFRAERFAQAEFAADQAIAGLTEVLEHDGENNEAWTLFGLALRAIRDVAKSETLLRATLRALRL